MGFQTRTNASFDLWDGKRSNGTHQSTMNMMADVYDLLIYYSVLELYSSIFRKKRKASPRAGRSETGGSPGDLCLNRSVRLAGRHVHVVLKPGAIHHGTR